MAASVPHSFAAVTRVLAAMATRYGACRDGALAPLFAVALVPVLVSIGAMVDLQAKAVSQTQLDGLADSSALAAAGYTAGSAADAEKVGLNVFQSGLSTLKRVTLSDLSVTVTDSALSRSAVVSYAGESATSLPQIVGVKSLAVRGSSSATLGRAPYIDFYLLLDNTPSMGVGATTADITKMVNNTSDKCAFACHDLSNSKSYYDLAKKLGVTMRIDVLRMATQQLMDTMRTTATVTNQFRVGIYTFGASATAAGLTSVAPLSSDIPSVKSAAGAIDLMTVPNSSYNNDMDTNFTGVLTSLNAAVPNPGDGTSETSRQKVVFFVSDGVADENNATSCSRPLTGTRCQSPINLALCTTLKNRGVKVAVLYTTYLPLPTNSWYNTWIAPFASSISQKMASCASPGLFFEVSPSQGVSDAMTALFRQSINSVRLTN
ncbi:pilus assembly protein TadG-related protein [Alsobacter sp. KACC 23698]|uniref:Pilus assembly protein TadG-related protein n=1 Tax=Alsobacter sp. KACC 23698 TaxID=3149229 RepID=A0AAU7JJE6_9HYPH